MVCRHDLERTSWAQRFRNLVRAVGAWGCLLGPLTWGVAPGWYGPGRWPASLRATDTPGPLEIVLEQCLQGLPSPRPSPLLRRGVREKTLRRSRTHHFVTHPSDW